MLTAAGGKAGSSGETGGNGGDGGAGGGGGFFCDGEDASTYAVVAAGSSAVPKAVEAALS